MALFLHYDKTMDMNPHAHLIINIDTDPDPVSVYQSDESVLAKYNRMRRIIGDHADGAGAYTVLTGPLYRDRFFQPPFLDFWRQVKEDGGNLVLHPEEDLYGPPPGKTGDRSTYEDIAHMEPIILGKIAEMKALGLPFDAYRGGYHGFTPQIGSVLRKAGLGIDLACAPGIVWPEKAAAWGSAPLSAYYMAYDACDRVAGPDEPDALFEIPFAWDGVAAGTSRRFVIGENYMINEFSTLEAMQKVWDAVLARRDSSGRSQFVSMICHTFKIDDDTWSDQLAAILDHVRAREGIFVTPTRAKAIFDAG